MRKTVERPGPMKVRRVKQGRKRNQRKCRTPIGHALEPRKTSKPKGQRRIKGIPRLETRHGTPIPSEYQGPPKAILNTSRTRNKEKGSTNLQRRKSFENRGTKCKRPWDVLRKLRATAEINAKIEKPSYHKMRDDGKALIKPFLSSHVGITLIQEAIQPLSTPA